MRTLSTSVLFSVISATMAMSVMDEVSSLPQNLTESTSDGSREPFSFSVVDIDLGVGNSDYCKFRACLKSNNKNCKNFNLSPISKAITISGDTDTGIFSTCTPVTKPTGCDADSGAIGYASNSNYCRALGILSAVTRYRDSDTNLVIKYEDGTSIGQYKVSLTLTIICDPKADKKSNPTNFKLSSGFQYSATWTTPYGCPASSGESGMSGVSIFVLIFFVTLVVYFIAGAAFRAGRMGERGVAVIPNREFWKDLPFLCKDGVLFTFGVCKYLFNRVTGRVSTIN